MGGLLRLFANLLVPESAGLGIPAVSVWGLVVLGLSILVAGMLLSAGMKYDKRGIPGRDALRTKHEVTGKRLATTLELVLVLSFLASRASGELRPRVPIRKPSTVGTYEAGLVLVVKFRDDLRVCTVGSGQVVSLVGAPLSNVHDLTSQFDATLSPVLRLPETTIQTIENRAATRSGVAQPDLASMMEVHADEQVIGSLAQSLLALPDTEWVQFIAAGSSPPCEDYGQQTADLFQYQEFHELAAVAHGASVLGIWGALDTPDPYQYGCIGLVPDATLWFFSEHPPDEPQSPAVRASTVADAIAAVDSGDIVLLEIQTFSGVSPGAPTWAPAEVSLPIWHLTKCATLSGIVVVAVAGNFGWNLDCPSCPECPGHPFRCVFDFSEYNARGDSGAIIVGAGTPDSNHDRCGQFSCGTFFAFGSNFGSRVNLQAWGDDITTLSSGPESYDPSFGGTSGAAPMVAAAVASVQSYVDSNHGCRLDPIRIRNLLIDTGIPQGTATAHEHIGPIPNVGAALFELSQIGSQDCNNNQIADACEYGDCNQNGVQDICDIAQSTSEDCNNNDIPDECEPDVDCNTNGVRDICDIGTGTSNDCNGNDAPDECDLTSGYSPDCNDNMIPDECDVWSETSPDCNFNFIPDECDVESQTSPDCDENGVPDECRSRLRRRRHTGCVRTYGARRLLCVLPTSRLSSWQDDMRVR